MLECSKTHLTRFLSETHNTQSSVIGQLTHAWPRATDNNRVAVLNQFLSCRTAAKHNLCSVMSQSHRIKGWATYEAFQEQCFLWERGTFVGVDSLTFKIFCMNKNHIKTLKERNKNKKSRLEPSVHNTHWCGQMYFRSQKNVEEKSCKNMHKTISKTLFNWTPWNNNVQMIMI